MLYNVKTDKDLYITSFEHTNSSLDTVLLEPSSMDLLHLNCYKLIKGSVILDSEKLARVLEEEQKPTELETISAQVLYTAVMTDTLIEKEGE